MEERNVGMLEDWKNEMLRRLPKSRLGGGIIRQFDNSTMEEWKVGMLEDRKIGRLEKWNVEAFAEITLRRGNN